MTKDDITKLPTLEMDVLSKHERHNNYAETRYWCDQYKVKARSLEQRLAAAVVELKKCHTYLAQEGMTNHETILAAHINQTLAAIEELSK